MPRAMAPHQRWIGILLLGLATGCTSTSVHEDNDPWEDTNRAIFGFNMGVIDTISSPLARGWTSITNEPVRESVSNFFNNIHYPYSLVNNLAQGKVGDAGTETLRFLINTTVGLGGIFDPASSWGLPSHEEDFGETMGSWGIAPGPYLMLPVFGPSNPRDSVGLIIWGVFHIFNEQWPYFIEMVNNSARGIDDFERERASALDFYAKVRNAYSQSRRNDVLDNAIDEELEEEEDDIYFMDIE